MTHRLQPALCLDLDGTVRRSKSDPEGFIKGVADIEIFPEMKKILPLYKQNGWLILGISNQAGVAWGHKTPQQNDSEIVATQSLTGNVFDVIKCCYHMKGAPHETYGFRSLLRKPDIGMLALLELECFQHGRMVDWDNSIFVGDREEDKGCAENAGIKFIWANEFRSMPHTFEIG